MVEREHRGIASGATEYQSACLQKQLLCFIINMVSYETLHCIPYTNNNNEEEQGELVSPGRGMFREDLITELTLIILLFRVSSAIIL